MDDRPKRLRRLHRTICRTVRVPISASVNDINLIMVGCRGYTDIFNRVLIRIYRTAIVLYYNYYNNNYKYIYLQKFLSRLTVLHAAAL